MKRFAGMLAGITFGSLAFGQTASPIQSSARPFGLDIAGPVMVAGSDAASATFRDSVLPGLTTYLATVMPEGQRLEQSSKLFDPSKIRLETDAQVRAYFLSESSSFANTLGFDVNGSGQSRESGIIFPDVSSGTARTTTTPLQPGDFVDLGKFEEGQKLDFFLVEQLGNSSSNGRGNSGKGNPSNNDLTRNVLSFATVYGSYLILGFEQTLNGKSDRDFNDLLFAIDLGSVNVAALIAEDALTSTPEPGTWLTLGCFLSGGWFVLRRRARPSLRARA